MGFFCKFSWIRTAGFYLDEIEEKLLEDGLQVVEGVATTQ
jgi:hypothetical protein